MNSNLVISSTKRNFNRLSNKLNLTDQTNYGDFLNIYNEDNDGIENIDEFMVHFFENIFLESGVTEAILNIIQEDLLDDINDFKLGVDVSIVDINKSIKELYLAGTVIRLDDMQDPQAPPIGTKGTVQYVDDIGNVHVSWDSGGSLALIPGTDKFTVLQENSVDSILEIKQNNKSKDDSTWKDFHVGGKANMKEK